MTSKEIAKFHMHFKISMKSYEIKSDMLPGWGWKFGTTKCRTTDISKFHNCEYSNNDR